MKNKPNVFLSGGFKSNWQEKIENKLSNKFNFFNPREHGLNNTAEYTIWDIYHVKECDIVLAYMEKTNPSGYGLAFEIGVAIGMNKTIILVDERSNDDPQFEKYFYIIKEAATITFKTIEEAVLFLESFSL